MKKKILPQIALAIACLWGHHAQSQVVVTNTVESNNVRAYVNTGGLLFNNFGLGTPGFEVPKQPLGTGTPKSAIYSSTLWLGGVDAGGTLRVAAQTYRQTGNDFIIGPIDEQEGKPVTDTFFNNLWRMTKADYIAARNGTQTDNLKNWPVSYTTPTGTYPFAPFHDANGDGKMDFDGNEYPIFPGDNALFFVYNDGGFHTETNSSPLGVEVSGFVYEINSPDNEFLNNTVFVDYYFTNKSGNTYHDFLASVWTDFDLGNYADDFIGSDTLRNMYYCYNSRDTDSGILGYGANPPAIGVMFLNNPLYASMGYTNDNSQTGNPLGASDYYDMMRARWKDGSPLTEGGNGFHTGNPTRYTLSGSPCDNTGWTEGNSGVGAGDRRMLGTVQLDTLLPGQVKKITVAYLWGRAPSAGAVGSLCEMLDQADSLTEWSNSNPSLSTPKTAAANTIKIYPNPASDKIFIDAENDVKDIALFDAAGRQILVATGNTLDVSGLAKGFYILRCKTNGTFFSQKIQVQ